MNPILSSLIIVRPMTGLEVFDRMVELIQAEPKRFLRSTWGTFSYLYPACGFRACMGGWLALMINGQPLDGPYDAWTLTKQLADAPNCYDSGYAVTALWTLFTTDLDSDLSHSLAQMADFREKYYDVLRRTTVQPPRKSMEDI